MDLKAAFDSVDHRVLWHILMTVGVLERIISLLAKLYDGAESCVWANSKDSDWLLVISGVRQGCVSVFDLFNIMLQVSQRIQEMQLNNYQLLDLEYTDDTTLFCESFTNWESALNIHGKEAVKMGLKSQLVQNQVDTHRG